MRAVAALEAGRAGDLVVLSRPSAWSTNGSETVMARIVEAFTTCSRETEFMERSWLIGSVRRNRRSASIGAEQPRDRRTMNLSEVTEEADLTHIFGKPSP
jgi:hypothetical protein